MYISGQVGKDPKTGVAVPGGVEEEAKQVWCTDHLIVRSSHL